MSKQENAQSFSPSKGRLRLEQSIGLKAFLLMKLQSMHAPVSPNWNVQKDPVGHGWSDEHTTGKHSEIQSSCAATEEDNTMHNVGFLEISSQLTQAPWVPD
mmetsp:Transcript_1831/g.3273  ORF Transcript_1831/g.3273 Transcript_1831/m.3273 type:complete len:101 (+) Transcript_1831:2107-2409(+)